MNKNLLTNLTKEQLINLATAIGLTKGDIVTKNGKVTKSQVIEEVLLTCNSLEVCENISFDSNRINALANNIALDEAINYDIADGVKMVVKEDELSISEVTQEDYDSSPAKETYEVTNDYNVGTLDVDFFTQDIRSAIFAELSAINKKYSNLKMYDIEPIAKLKEAMTELGLQDRLVDFALTCLPSKIRECYDIKSITRSDLNSIIECYNEEQIAKTETFIRNIMANKKPSEKQMTFFVSMVQLATDKGYTELIEEGRNLKRNFSKSALDVKDYCDLVQAKLRLEPMTEKQESLLKSMNSLGMKLKYKGLSYGEASKLIGENLPMFNRLTLLRNLKTFGFNQFSLDTIKHYDDEQVKSLAFSVKRVGSYLGLVFKYTNQNVFELIEVLSDLTDKELTTLKNACLTNDMTFVKSII